jgi:histidyl-tRNA synthetase
MIQLIRGFKDILPGEIETWQQVERTACNLLEDFGFREIRIPILERTELFARSIGEDTDIVEKEMYTFADRKGEMITLRPEATASVVRAYIQHRMYAVDPIQKFYTIGPMFRRERPQKGRYRQFYQINAEVFGVTSPLIDAQLVFILMTLLKRLGVTGVRAHINSLGCPECRPEYRSALGGFLAGRDDRLCADCRRRRNRNPLRVLDCKVPSCRDAMTDAPSILEHLCGDCRADFETLQMALERLGVDYMTDKRLVRGLDYYTRTTFEIQTGALGAQSAVAGGGRYDGLVTMLDGPDMPATGFAIGLDRLAEVVGQQKSVPRRPPALFAAALGDQGRKLVFEWISRWCESGLRADMDFSGRSLKSQMKRADKLGARLVLIVGEDELAQGEAILRDMKSKKQVRIALEEIPAKVPAIIGDNKRKVGSDS